MNHKAYNIKLLSDKVKVPCENLSIDDKITQDITLYYKQGEFTDMSLVFVYKSENRIILASESRSVRRIGDTINYIDGFKKIIYLKEANLALISAGPNIINNKNITDFFLSKEELLKGKSVKESLEILSQEIDFLRKDFGDNVLLISANRFDKSPESFSVGISKDKIEITENSTLWHNGSVVLDKLYISSKDLIVPNIDIYSEKQIIDFLTHIIKTEENYRQYSGQMNSIGGDIQFLILDKYGVKEIS